MEDLKAEGGHREKIGRNHLSEVVAQESGPGLAGTTTWLADHVFANGSLGNWDTQLEQFAMNAGRAPQGVSVGHVPNQINGLRGNAFPAGPAGPTLPFPEEPKTPPMPVDDGLGLDQSDRLPPPTPNH